MKDDKMYLTMPHRERERVQNHKRSMRYNKTNNSKLTNHSIKQKAYIKLSWIYMPTCATGN